MLSTMPYNLPTPSTPMTVVLQSKLITIRDYAEGKYKAYKIKKFNFCFSNYNPEHFIANRNIGNCSPILCILVVNVKLSAGFSGHLTKRIQVH